MKSTRNRCPDCKKLMVRHKRQKEFWWNCSGYPRCFVTAQDYKGRPEFIGKKQREKIDFLRQLDFIKFGENELKVQILIRLIQKKGGIEALSAKHQFLYFNLIEPLRASISFTKCRRCNIALDAEESLKLGENWYECDWCWC